MLKFKAIIFDYGGVIYGTFNAPGIGIFENLCTHLNLDIEEFKALYFANNYRNNLENWSHKETLLFVVSKLAPEKEEQAAKIIDTFIQKCALNEELLDSIKKIKKKGYIIALLSNYNQTLRDLIAVNGVAEIFGENVFISTEIGYQKPNPKAFEHTFQKLNLKPDEVIFIDDSQKSLSTAEAVGYYPIRFITNDQLFENLKNLGISFEESL